MSIALALAIALSIAGVARAQSVVAPIVAPTVTPIVTPIVTPQASTPQVDREIQVASDAFAKDPALPAWVEPHAIPASKASGPAVVLLSETQIMVADRATTYTRRAMQVNDALVLSQVGRVPIAFIPAYQRVVLHTLRLIRDGAVLDRLPDAQVRFLQRETGLEHNVYSGVVTASMLVDDLRVGDVLEVAFSTIGTNPVFGAAYGGIEAGPAGPHDVSPRDPQHAGRAPHRMEDARRARQVLAGAVGTHAGRHPVRHVRGGGAARAAGRGAGSPRLRGLSPLQFSEYADWNGVARWASSLFDDREPPSAERVALVATLAARPTVEERVVAALEFVQSQVRYFSVSLGTSSHRPTAPNVVLARRYGDCKDKSLLLMALLKDLGIASTPVLARLGNRTGFDDWLPTPLAFDHVIIAVDVDGARWFLDSTRLGQHGKLARMGQAHDGSQVLVAAAATTALHRIDVANRDALALDDRIETMTITKLDGDGDLTVVHTQFGIGAETSRVLLAALPKDRIDALFTAEMEKRYPGAKLIEPARFDDDRTENRLSGTLRFRVPKPMQRIGTIWRVDFRPDNFARVFAVPQDSNRRAPVLLRYPLNVRYRFDAELPDDVSATIDPVVAAVSNRWFVSTTERSFRGNRSQSTATLRTLTDRVTADELPKLRDEVAKFERGFPTMVVFGESSIKRSAFVGTGKKDLAQTLKTRQEETVVKVTATIDSGRLTGMDLARAYCERASALISLGRKDEALADGIVPSRSIRTRRPRCCAAPRSASLPATSRVASTMHRVRSCSAPKAAAPIASAVRPASISAAIATRPTTSRRRRPSIPPIVRRCTTTCGRRWPIDGCNRRYPTICAHARYRTRADRGRAPRSRCWPTASRPTTCTRSRPASRATRQR